MYYYCRYLCFPSSAELVTWLRGNTCHRWEPVWRVLTLAALWGSRWQFPNESFLLAWGAKTWKKRKEEKKKKSSRLSEAVNGDFVSLPLVFSFFLKESKPHWIPSKTSMFGPATGKDSHVIYFFRWRLYLARCWRCFTCRIVAFFRQRLAPLLCARHRPLLRAGLINAVGMQQVLLVSQAHARWHFISLSH